MPKEQDRPTINRNVHPPIVALIFIVIALVLGRFVPISINVPVVLRNVGFALTFIGLLCGVSAFLEFRKARTTLDPHGSTKQLVTSGIYRFTRNPIYLGFLLMIIGFPLNAGFYSGIVVAPFFTLAMNRLVIEKEETYLEKKFKDVYASYKSSVRRWL